MRALIASADAGPTKGYNEDWRSDVPMAPAPAIIGFRSEIAASM